MTLFYLVTFGGIGCSLIGVGYYLGRIVEYRRSRTRGVTLADFHKLTRSR